MPRAFRVFLLTGVLVAFTLSCLLAQGQVKKIPQRSDIDDKYKWRLQDIFANDELWEQLHAAIPDVHSMDDHLATLSGMYEDLVGLRTEVATIA